MVPDDDPAGDVEPQARALARFLCREERVEDALRDLRRDARAVVLDFDADEVARARCPERHPFRCDRKRVVDEVRPDLVELGRVRLDPRQRAVVLADDLDPALGDLVGEDRERALEAVVDVDLLTLRLVEIRVLPHRLDELRDALGRVLELAGDSRCGEPGRNPADDRVRLPRRNGE